MHTMKDECKDSIVLLLFILIFVLFLISCTHSNISSLTTKDAIDICGCDRSCILRMQNIKGYDEIHERTYSKYCK